MRTSAICSSIRPPTPTPTCCSDCDTCTSRRPGSCWNRRMADLPADLRWLFESGAVTVEQLAALHHALGATSAGDLGAAVADHAIRAVEGLNESIEDAIARRAARSPAGGSAHSAGPGGHAGGADPRAAALDARRGVGQRRRFAAPRPGYGRRHRDRGRDHRARRTPSPSCSSCRTSCAVSIAATAACTCCSSAFRSAYACRSRAMQARRCCRSPDPAAISPRCAPTPRPPNGA